MIVKALNLFLLIVSSIFFALSGNLALYAQEDKELTTDINLVNYTNSKYKISIEYPSEWTKNDTDPDPNDDIKFIVQFDSPLETLSDDYSEYIQIVKDSRIFNDVKLEDYLNESISIYNDTRNNFKVIDTSTSKILSGQPAYSLTFTEDIEGVDGEAPFKLESYETGTLVNNTAYYITYAGAENQYNRYLPLINKIISSFNISGAVNSDLSKSITTPSNIIDENLTGSVDHTSQIKKKIQDQTPSNNTDPRFSSNLTIKSLNATREDTMQSKSSSSFGQTIANGIGPLAFDRKKVVDTDLMQFNNTKETLVGNTTTPRLPLYPSNNQSMENTKENLYSTKLNPLSTSVSDHSSQSSNVNNDTNNMQANFNNDIISGKYTGNMEKGGQSPKTVDIFIKEKLDDFTSDQTFEFIPNEAAIDVGTTIKWINNESSVHTVTSNDLKPDNSGIALFDSDYMGKGDSFSYTFTKPGKFEYHDENDENLKGIVFVKQTQQQTNNLSDFKQNISNNSFETSKDDTNTPLLSYNDSDIVKNKDDLSVANQIKDKVSDSTNKVIDEDSISIKKDNFSIYTPIENSSIGSPSPEIATELSQPQNSTGFNKDNGSISRGFDLFGSFDYDKYEKVATEKANWSSSISKNASVGPLINYFNASKDGSIEDLFKDPQFSNRVASIFNNITTITVSDLLDLRKNNSTLANSFIVQYQPTFSHDQSFGFLGYFLTPENKLIGLVLDPQTGDIIKEISVNNSDYQYYGIDPDIIDSISTISSIQPLSLDDYLSSDMINKKILVLTTQMMGSSLVLLIGTFDDVNDLLQFSIIDLKSKDVFANAKIGINNLIMNATIPLDKLLAITSSANNMVTSGGFFG